MARTSHPVFLSYQNIGLIIVSDARTYGIRLFFLFLQIKVFFIMNRTNRFIPAKVYTEPSLRLIETNFEISFLHSNLEPIDGGDDPVIDW